MQKKFDRETISDPDYRISHFTSTEPDSKVTQLDDKYSTVGELESVHEVACKQLPLFKEAPKQKKRIT